MKPRYCGGFVGGSAQRPKTRKPAKGRAGWAGFAGTGVNSWVVYITFGRGVVRAGIGLRWRVGGLLTLGYIRRRPTSWMRSISIARHAANAFGRA